MVQTLHVREFIRRMGGNVGVNLESRQDGKTFSRVCKTVKIGKYAERHGKTTRQSKDPARRQDRGYSRQYDMIKTVQIICLTDGKLTRKLINTEKCPDFRPSEHGARMT